MTVRARAQVWDREVDGFQCSSWTWTCDVEVQGGEVAVRNVSAMTNPSGDRRNFFFPVLLHPQLVFRVSSHSPERPRASAQSDAAGVFVWMSSW